MVQLSIALSGEKPLQTYADLAVQVEQYDFDTLSIYDDLMFKPAWITLGVVAQATNRIRIGPAVSNPYLVHPAILAGNVAQLDELSGGRAYLGIGRGAFLDFLGLESKQAVAAVRESIEMINRLLCGDHTPYNGSIFQATESAFLRWSPPREHVPVVVGTWGKRMCEMSGEIADEVKAGAAWSSKVANQMWDYISRGASRVERDPGEVTLVMGPLTSIAEDREEALAVARRSLSIYLPFLSPMTEYAGIDPDELERVKTASIQGDYEEAARFISDETLTQFALCGTPNDCIDEIERMVAETPVGRIEFGTPHGPDESKAIQLLGERVLPHFNR